MGDNHVEDHNQAVGDNHVEEPLEDAEQQPDNTQNIQVGIVRTLMPQIDPAILKKGYRQSLLPTLDSRLTGKQPMQSPSSDPFAFDSFDWANSDSKGTTTSPSLVSLRNSDRWLSFR